MINGWIKIKLFLLFLLTHDIDTYHYDFFIFELELKCHVVLSEMGQYMSRAAPVFQLLVLLFVASIQLNNFGIFRVIRRKMNWERCWTILTVKHYNVKLKKSVNKRRTIKIKIKRIKHLDLFSLKRKHTQECTERTWTWTVWK